MYRLIAICVFAIFVKDVTASLSEEQKYQISSIFYKLGEECYLEYPITAEEAQEFMKLRFPAGDRAGCFGACVLKKAGIFDGQGMLSENSALESAKLVANEEQLETVAEMLHACSAVNERLSDSEGCQRAASAYNCLMDQAHAYGIFK